MNDIPRQLVYIVAVEIQTTIGKTRSYPSERTVPSSDLNIAGHIIASSTTSVIRVKGFK